MKLLFSKQDYRSLVVGIDTQVPIHNGQKTIGINFDNAATTPPLVAVMDEINKFVPYYSSIHRGGGYKALISSQKYEEARKSVMDFVGANPKKDVVIFVKNATEAINKVAYRLWKEGQEKSVILSTYMEHHSNDLPWRDKYKVDYIEVDECGRLIFEDYLAKLEKYKGRVQLVTVTGASNVTGYVNDVHRIAEWAHKYGAKILVDGSQLIPHIPFDLKSSSSVKHIDYLVFSAHKMYAPFGVGVLIGPKKVFLDGSPDYSGGGTVKAVTHSSVIWNDPPLKEEAGTPNLIGVIALAAAIKKLKEIGMKNIENHEKALTKHLIRGLKDLDNIELYCVQDEEQVRVGIVPFNIKNMYHETTAKILAEESAIAVRSGCFCAHPYVQKLMNLPAEKIKKYAEDPDTDKPGMVRVSFGIANTHEEIEIFLETLKKISRNYRMFKNKYE